MELVPFTKWKYTRGSDEARAHVFLLLLYLAPSHLPSYERSSALADSHLRKQKLWKAPKLTKAVQINVLST